ncbi:MAG: aldehyde ferredoxin oxidoreductase C-terminal domain-containing protein [Desulfohalobiaceae bacterium]
MAQGMGFLPTRNFQESVFQAAGNFSGEKVQGYQLRRKGCFNCTVGCSRFCIVEEGQYAGTKGEGPEYESISAFGSKCGNPDLEAVLKANMLCNQLGLDTISAGNVLAWAMEALEKGIISRQKYPDLSRLGFGQPQAMLDMLSQIAYRQGSGDILAQGSWKAAQILGGKEMVVQSKGLDYPAVDVRGTKGMALSFAVSPRGGDHLKGLCMYEIAPDVYSQDIKQELGLEPGGRFWLQYENKARLMAWQEDWHCVLDSLGLCKLEGIALKPLLPRHFHRLLTTCTGWPGNIQDLRQAGQRIWNLERIFNCRQGLGRKDDYPPQRLLQDPIHNGPSQGETLNPEKYEALLLEYYTLRGWDQQSGAPGLETLSRLGLQGIRASRI